MRTHRSPLALVAAARAGVGLSALLAIPAFGQTAVRWIGPAGGDFMNPANWDPAVVPINGTPNAGDTYAVTVPANAVINFGLTTPGNFSVQTLSLGAGSRIVTRPGRTFSVAGDADINGSIDATQGGNFLAPNAVGPILNGSWYRAGAGSTIQLGAVSYAMSGVRYGNYTLFSADGTGSTVDAHAMRTLHAGWDDADGTWNASTISASNGGVVNLSGVETLTTPARFEDRIDLVMSTGGSVNLDALQTINGGGQARFIVPAGATYSLPSLTTAANLRVELGAGSTFSAPQLSTLSGPGYAPTDLGTILNTGDFQNRAIVLGDNSTVNMPSLVAIDRVRIDQNTGSVFNAPNLDRMNFSFLRVGAGTSFNTGAMSNIDNSAIHVSGGRQFGVSSGNIDAASYSMTGLRYGNATVFSADGAGSVLDLSSLRTFNAGWDDSHGNWYATTVAATNGGVVDLSGVQTLTTPARGGEDYINFLMETGGAINLDGLQTINGGGMARFMVPAGATYSLPALTTAANLRVELGAGASFSAPQVSALTAPGFSADDLGTIVNADQFQNRVVSMAENSTVNMGSLASIDHVRIDQSIGSVFNAPSLRRMNFSFLRMAPGTTFNTGALSNIDNSAIHVSGGRRFGVSSGNIDAASYSMTGLRYGNATVFSADGAGSVLDLSSLRTFNAGWDDSHGNWYATTVAATSGGVVDLSGVQTLTTPARGGEDYINFLMESGGTINLDGLQTINGGGMARFMVPAGATYSLPALTTAANLRVELGAGGTFSAPQLSTLNAPGYAPSDLATIVDVGNFQNRAIVLAENSTVNMGSLVSINRVRIDQATGSVFNAPNLNRMNFSFLRVVPGMTLNTAVLSNIDNSAIHVSGGRQFGVSSGNIDATSYSMTGLRYGNATVFSASGSGSALDLSSFRTFNAGWDDSHGNWYATTVAATSGGVVDLSGVQTLTTPARGGEDYINFLMESGGTINLDGLQTINGGGMARFIVQAGATYSLPALANAANLRLELGAGATMNMPVVQTINSPGYAHNQVGAWRDYNNFQNRALVLGEGATLNLPALTAVDHIRFDLAAGSTLNAPSLDRMNFGFLRLSPGTTLTTAAMSNIDNSVIDVSGGRHFGVRSGNISATGYSMLGYGYGDGTVFSSTGTGSLLDLSSVRTFDAGWNDSDGNAYTTYVVASNNGGIDLSRVETLVTPARGEDRIEFNASSGGLIDLTGLRTVSGAGQARFVLSGGGQMHLGDITVGNNVNIAVQDVDSRLTVDRSLTINSGSFTVAAGAEVDIGKHFVHRLTNESAFQASTSILRMTGTGLHFLEIAGLDVGPVNPGNNGNFGLGHLIIGAEGAPLTLQLLDLLDNGNRGQNLNEALYLFGVGQGMDSDALTLLGGSTLYIDNLDVYVRENGEWVWLNSLFGPGQTVIPYGGGFVHLPAPGTAGVLGLGVMALARRRRGPGM